MSFRLRCGKKDTELFFFLHVPSFFFFFFFSSLCTCGFHNNELGSVFTLALSLRLFHIPPLLAVLLLLFHFPFSLLISLLSLSIVVFLPPSSPLFPSHTGTSYGVVSTVPSILILFIVALSASVLLD